jgi:hypothetical protein
MTRLGSVLGCLVAAVSFGCTPTYTTTSFEHGPIRDLRIDRGDAGRWLAAMPGATGIDVKTLDGGDVLLVGHARSSFVQRLSPDGEKKWSFPLVGCGATRVAAGGDDAIYVATHGLLELGEASREMLRSKNVLCRQMRVRAPTTIFRLNARGEIRVAAGQ